MVIVVGAGPTGLVLAIELARRGVKCRILEKTSERTDQSRALLIQARTLEIFEHIGIVNKILDEAVHMKGVTIHAGKKERPIDFVSLDSPYPYGVILPQARTEAMLEEHLNTLGIFVERDHEFTLDDPYEGWLVGCDGAHSVVRHRVHATFEGRDFEHSFALGDIHFNEPFSEDRLHMFFLKRGVLGIFPLPGGWHRVLFNHVDPSGAMAPTLKQFQTMVKERIVDLTIKDASWLSYFHLHSRKISKYRFGKTFLAGDAAHIHSPAGGLGMNTGIQDAYNLGWKLAGVYNGDYEESILDSYELEREPVAREVLSVTERITDFIAAPGLLKGLLRRMLIPLLPKIAGKRVLNFMAQLNVAYKKSPLSKGPMGGKRFYKSFTSLKWILLVPPRIKIDEICLKKYRKNVDIVYIKEGSDLILLRPDHYIGFSGAWEGLTAYLDRILL